MKRMLRIASVRKVGHRGSAEGGGESLTTIALDTGFADQGHFSRWFKEATGMTPGAYRASAGE